MGIEERLEAIEKKMDQLIEMLAIKQTVEQSNIDIRVRNTLNEEELRRVNHFARFYTESPEHIEFTASEIAERCGIDADMARLRAIAAHIKNRYPVKEVRRSKGRMIRFN